MKTRPNQSQAQVNPFLLTILGGMAIILIFALWIANPSNKTDQSEKVKNTIGSNSRTPKPPLSNSTNFLSKVYKTGKKNNSTESNSMRFPGKPENVEGRIQSALRHGSRETRQNILNQLAPELAVRDLKRATKLVEELLISNKTKHAAPPFVREVINQLFKQSPENAFSWVKSLPNEEMQSIARDHTVHHWIEQDLTGVSQWASMIENENLRKNYIGQIGAKYLEAPPSSFTATWARDLALSPDAVHHTDIIAQVWARSDLPEASNWAENIPDPVVQTRATVEIAFIVAENGLDAVVEWIGDLPNDDGYQDEVITHVAHALDGQDPGTGTELAKRFNHIYAPLRESSSSRP